MLKLDKNKKYLLACSFGTDSMVLLHLLLEDGYDFSVAHVNYNLRSESKSEQQKLNDFCLENNLQLFIHEVNETLGDSNLEAKCRDIRYKFFKELYETHKFDALLVAHQEDDLIETYLLQIKRKNIVSYYGLHQERVVFGMNVLRPLLDWSKNDILAYLTSNNIPHSIDKTNLEDTYSRNKIRHSVVEKLSESERKEIRTKIDTLNEKTSKNRLKLSKLDLNSKDILLSLSDEELPLAVHMLLENSNLFHPISQKMVQSIKKILLSEKPNVILKISKTINFIKEYDKVSFVTNYQCNDYEYVLSKPTVLDTPYFKLDFRGDTSNRNVKESDYPLTIRNAKKDDKFYISGYEVTVRRAFIDWKMPMSLRNKWPVICNKEGKVIYVPRYSKNFKCTGKESFIVKI